MKVRKAPLLLSLMLAACGSNEKSGSNGQGLGGGDEDGGVDDGGHGDGDGDLSAGDGDDAGNGGSNPDSGYLIGNGMPELCDGIDNDADGIIDNLDAEKDGVCDCLNIATIGQIGGWSTGGNVFEEWLNARSPIGAVELANQVLTDDLLRPFQVIVVLHVGTTAEKGGRHELTPHHVFSVDEVAALERWVRAGGGLMTTIGYSDEVSEVENVNRLLSPLGMAYSTTKKDTNGFVEQWVEHPISANVKKIRTDNGVQPDGSQAMTLATDQSDRVALQVGEPDAGHVVVWGDEWITYDSEWQDTKDQQVDRLWLNMLKWMSPTNICQVALPPVLLL